MKLIDKDNATPDDIHRLILDLAKITQENLDLKASIGYRVISSNNIYKAKFRDDFKSPTMLTTFKAGDDIVLKKGVDHFLLVHGHGVFDTIKRHQIYDLHRQSVVWIKQED